MAIFALNNVAPQLPAGFFWVADSACVIGDVVIGTDASIWFGSVLRGDNEPITIGDGTNIQDQCMLHTDPGFPITIGAGCTVGHRVTLHGCTVGKNSLIGMSATILNGAKIGDNCLIGAGALVTEGKEIPDNSVAVGVPAKVRRTVDAAAAAELTAAAAHYVANARRFAAGLKRQDSGA